MISFFDPQNLAETLRVIGYLGIASIIFTESGLFFGFFLPGDSLLFTSGILAAMKVFHLPLLLFVICVSAILGDNVGYSFGRFVGVRLFNKEDSFFFKKKHIIKAKEFYEIYGKKAIVLARFIPVVRTFIPIVAGVIQMEYKIFFTYNVVGAFLWGIGITMAGYLLGMRVANIEEYLTPIIVLIIFVSFMPIFREYLKSKKK